MCYSEAWLNDIPVKEGESVSVYISHPVPARRGGTKELYIERSGVTLEIVVLP